MQIKLLKLSLIISILGIFLLLILTNLIKPQQVNNYQQLSQLKLNQLATTTGKVISVYSTNDFNIIKLNNNLTLTFNQKNLQLKQNQTITATGIISSYQSSLQIQANKIKINL